MGNDGSILIDPSLCHGDLDVTMSVNDGDEATPGLPGSAEIVGGSKHLGWRNKGLVGCMVAS